MSDFWKFLTKDTNKEGIISKDKPFEFEYNDIKLDEETYVNIYTNEKIDQEVLKFVVENGLSSSGNSYLINPKTSNENVNVIIKNRDTNEILGFAFSITNNLRLNEEKIESGLTTNLCVSLKHRKKDLAKLIISSIIDYGYKNSIYTGYHFIGEPRTESNIMVYNYFRPLNIQYAVECGYQIPERDYTLKNSSDYSIKKSQYSDFELCNKVNRYLTLNLSEEQFNNQFTDSECLTITYKGKVVGVCIIKTILLRIGKLNKVCPIARAVFIESKNKHIHNTFSQLINYLIGMKKHVVLSGVCMGNLSNSSIRNQLGMIISGKSYLDFYNIHIDNENKNIENINLMYV